MSTEHPIHEFISAGLDEDEATALAAAEAARGHATWSAPNPEDWDYDEEDTHHPDLMYQPAYAVAVHKSRFDPARVLREVKAKRRILAAHHSIDWAFLCDLACGACGVDEYPTPWPCDTLRSLAEVYSDRPGYDPAWAVTA